MFVMAIALALALDDVDDLVERLGHRSIGAREDATAALIARGKKIEDRLRRVKSDDPEVGARIEIILDELAYLVEAEAVRVHIVSNGIFLEPARGRAEPLEKVGGGYQCTLAGGVRYDTRKTRDVVVDLLRREIARPFDLDLPAAFELLTSYGGYPELVPALEERARKTADPAVKAVCERAIRYQKEDP